MLNIPESRRIILNIPESRRIILNIPEQEDNIKYT